MDIQYFGPVAAAVFVLQFILCMKKASLLLRLLPTVVLALGIAGCALAAFLAPSAFAAPIFGALLVILLVLDGLGWLTAFLVEKHRK
ncbi:MAG: hypothetical protein IJZ39_03755 [Oscillospiraceae bacterium]|nr:hypothetical protein [Oscillospiraceae bacterium]